MLKSTFIILATSYFAWHLERFETSVIYPFDNTYETPASAGEPRLRETRFVTTDGEELILWRSAPRDGRPTILYFPGNAGGLRDRVERFSHLIDRGYGVTALGYRGSSGSTGRPNEMALVEDAIAVSTREVARPLVLYGESLGTAVAIKLAGRGVGDAVVLEAPFTSVVELIERQHPTEDLDHLVTQRWESLDGAAAVRQRLLVIHGSDDHLVPVQMGRAIFAVAGSVNKRFLEIDGGSHNDLWSGETLAVLYDFLENR